MTSMLKSGRTDDEDSVFLCLAINALSVGLDIIILGVHYPGITDSHTAEFSAVMGIFNLLLRVISCYVLFKERLTQPAFVSQLS